VAAACVCVDSCCCGWVAAVTASAAAADATDAATCACTCICATAIIGLFGSHTHREPVKRLFGTGSCGGVRTILEGVAWDECGWNVYGVPIFSMPIALTGGVDIKFVGTNPAGSAPRDTLVLASVRSTKKG
jgi:hypothetical protein